MYNKRQAALEVTTTARPILREIETHLDQLRPSERKVAELVAKLNRGLQSLRTTD
jgi:hypothetical protein